MLTMMIYYWVCPLGLILGMLGLHTRSFEPCCSALATPRSPTRPLLGLWSASLACPRLLRLFVLVCVNIHLLLGLLPWLAPARFVLVYVNIYYWVRFLGSLLCILDLPTRSFKSVQSPAVPPLPPPLAHAPASSWFMLTFTTRSVSLAFPRLLRLFVLVYVNIHLLLGLLPWLAPGGLLRLGLC